MSEHEHNDPLKQADEDIGFATLVRGEINGEPFWAYASIRPSKFDEFLALQKEQKPYRLTDYGDILEYRIGEKDPSDEVKARMEEEFGIDHEFEAKIEESAILAARTFEGPKPGG